MANMRPAQLTRTLPTLSPHLEFKAEFNFESKTLIFALVFFFFFFLVSQEDTMIGTGTNFVDEIDCGSFFDNIDDLMEDVDSVLGPAPDCDSAFPSSLWPAHSGASLPAPEAAVFSGNGDSDFSSELPVPVSTHSIIVQSVSYLTWRQFPVSVSRDCREW